jgi:hypothetical protein
MKSWWTLWALGPGLLLVSCRSPWSARPLTDQEIVDEQLYYPNLRQDLAEFSQQKLLDSCWAG